ncbi:SHOCT domain-containing protein [Defluviicoccus vanus]
MGDVSLFVGGGAGGGSNWWPADLGSPSSTGAQNDVRYAWFPATRRLAIDLRGEVTVYDTGDHQIGGVSQQQGGGASLTFTSQYGLVRVADLPVVAPAKVTGNTPPARRSRSRGGRRQNRHPSCHRNCHCRRWRSRPRPRWSCRQLRRRRQRRRGRRHRRKRRWLPPAADVFATLEKLADLHARGILSAEEFQAKKKDLLSRL